MRSVIEYQEKKSQQLNEVFDFFIFINVLSSIVYILIHMVSYISGVIFHRSVKGVEDKKYSNELSKIVNEEVVCIIVRNKILDAYNVNQNKCYMSDSFFKILSHEERIAIFLHEYAHYKYKHIIKVNLLTVTLGTLFITLINFATSIFFGLILPFLGYFLGHALGVNLSNIYSRIQEKEADIFVVDKGYGKYLSTALKKTENWIKKQICKDVSREECDQYFEKIDGGSTHPSYKERYQYILNTEPVKKFIMNLADKNLKNIGENNKSIYTKTTLFIKNIFSSLFNKEKST